jgi:flagellar biosynthetic protein FliQ
MEYAGRLFVEELLTASPWRNPMGPDQVTELMRMLLKEALIISGPILLLATVVSLSVSLTLTLLSLQDQTLSTVPRLVTVAAAILVGAPWIVRRMAEYTIALFSDLHRFAR